MASAPAAGLLRCRLARSYRDVARERAVSVLYAADTRSSANGTDLWLLAPAGGPAEQILTLVQLPHTTDNPDPGANRPRQNRRLTERT